MPPKAAAQGTVDIRSFFGGKPKPKPAAETSPAAPKKVEEQPPAPPQPAAPPCDAASSGGSKPARTPSRGKGATPSKSNAGGTNSGSKGKAAAAAPAAGAPTAKSPASGSGSKKRAPAGRPTSRAQAKRKQVVDSDDEGGAGSDSWDDGGEESGSGSDLEVDLTMSDAEVEAAPVAAAGSAGKKQKEQQTKAPAAGKQKAEAAAVGEPAAKRAKATPRSAALKKLPAALQRIADNPHAMAAVAAVDAAAAKLPVKQLEDLTFLPDGYGGGKAPDEPPNRGGKRTPRGHPDCLTNKTFVITGVLDSLLREEAEDLIKRHGGKVTSSVSGKTSFLLAGAHMGRSKYYHAKDKGVPMIDEDGLFSLIRAAPPPDGGPAEDELPAGPQQARQAAAPAAAGVKAEPGAPAPVAPAGPSGSAAATRPASFYGSGQQQQQQAAPSAAVAALNAPPGGGGPAHRGESQQLWVEKWRPKTSAELVGNQGMVGTLKHWLRDWERVNLHGGVVQPPPSMKGKRDADQGLKKKAVLLSGPPGIGKTSAALIVCRELGYEPVEVNASDTRGKSDASVLKGVGGKLANAVKELSTNRAVSYDKEGRRKKLCLIMDEVDGMSAGDRGGVADLILTIKNTRVPIICICNEKYSTKLRSLRNHTLELDFRKPMVNQISKRMLEICAKEGLTVNQATMDALVQSANGGDIRLILGQLQMIRLRARSLSYDQVKSGGMSTAKDLEMSPFEAARRLLSFEGDGLSLNDQLDLVFQDLDLVPLLVQENYLNHRPKLAGNDAQRLRIIAKAADGVSAGDVATRAVRQYQNWSLAPFAAAMGTVYPATYMRGGREVFGLYPGEPNFPRFTSWLGNNSSAGKQRRLLGELHTRMLSSGHLECDRTGLRLAYLPVMRNTLSTPLVKEGKDGIPAVLRLMRDYCISREDVDFITDVTKFKTQKDWGKDPMKDVETQVKSAFTREFNKQHIKPKTGFGMEGGVSKKRRSKAAAAAEDDEEDAFGGEALVQEDGGSAGKSQGAEEEEEEELDPVLLQQKLKGMKHKGMTVTLKDGSTAKPSGGKGRGGAKSGGGRGSGGGAKSGGRGSGGGRGRGKK